MQRALCKVPYAKYLPLTQSATFTRPINTGTSINRPITPTKACVELIPKTDIATAIASSKLFDAAVKLNDTDYS